jgi:hypothetical protein
VPSAADKIDPVFVIGFVDWNWKSTGTGVPDARTVGIIIFMMPSGNFFLTYIFFLAVGRRTGHLKGS